MTTTIGILGAGAWGTALAVHLARRSDLRIVLWARDAAQARTLAAERVNAKYLPGVPLPERLAVEPALQVAVQANLLIAATPVASLLAVVAAAESAGARAPLVWLSKGFVAVPPTSEFPAGAALPHQVLAARWTAPVGVVSGPSFAEEVARGLPTA